MACRACGAALTTGARFCAACGTHLHVHPVPGNDWVAFCVDCWDRAGPPRVGEDLGESE